MNGFIKFPVALYTLSLGLSLAQSRVLAVIMRQTIGWHKTHDAISLSQFQHGVGKEPGTGMSRSHIVAALRFLEAQNIIHVVRQVTADGISQTSIYSLAERFLDANAPTINVAAAEVVPSVVEFGPRPERVRGGEFPEGFSFILPSGAVRYWR